MGPQVRVPNQRSLIIEEEELLKKDLNEGRGWGWGWVWVWVNQKNI